VCAVEVPCGLAARDAFARVGVVPSVDTFELDVKAVFTKLDVGEVDAGLIYRTDVRGSVEAIEFEGADASPTSYPIAALTTTDASVAFVDFVLSDAGQRILREAGFGAP
jgi:molybdate transport system substrate-binding protein